MRNIPIIHLTKELSRARLVWFLVASLQVSGFAAEPASPDSGPPAGSWRFMPIEVYIDPHGTPLAAYQFELTDRDESIEIVGVEGGSHPSFSRPPYYDPKAIAYHRIVVAAFSTHEELPTSKSRVCTVHIMQKADIDPNIDLKLSVAATRDRSRIKATASYTLGEAE